PPSLARWRQCVHPGRSRLLQDLQHCGEARLVFPGAGAQHAARLADGGDGPLRQRGLHRLAREEARTERSPGGAGARAAPEAELDGPALAAGPLALVAFVAAEEVELAQAF